VDARQFRERLRHELDAVKQPSDLAPIIREFTKGRRDSEEANNPQYYQGLSMRLTALEAAWKSDDLNRLANEFSMRGGADDGALSEDLGNLRDRAEREVLSRSLNAPELLQAPLASQPLAKALESLLAKLAAGGEWRRALRIMEAQAGLEQMSGAAPRKFEAIGAVRSYLAGQNFELAELWRGASELRSHRGGALLSRGSEL
jgi:hypothetical protein